MKTFSRRHFNQKTVFALFIMLWLPGFLFGQINVTFSSTNITCFGAANGQTTAIPADGWFPYFFAWSNGATTETIQNLAPGHYTVTVSDIDQNTKIASVLITQPPQLGVTVFASSVICDAAPDGTASCIPHGGTPPFSYIWNNGSTSPQINNLYEGTYTVTVTDAQNCVTSDSAVVNAWHEGLWTMISHTPAICPNADGTAHISIMSGTAPYQYLWNTGSTTADVEDLSAGTYTISVSDVNGCSTTGTVLVIEQGVLLNALNSFATCGYNDGAVQVYPLSGVSPYQYLWSNGSTTQSIDSLAQGIYTATVTDAIGCTGMEEALVASDGSSPIPYLLSGPKCLHQIATFVGEQPPPLYPEMFWSLSNPTDQIIAGQGTDSIQVQWGSIGHKLVTMQYGINGVYCGGNGFEFNVVVCAGTEETPLSAAVVSPNPFSEFVRVEFPAGLSDDMEVFLTDASGRIVLGKTLKSAADILPTGNIPGGVYFLKIKSAEGERAWKLVKQ